MEKSSVDVDSTYPNARPFDLVTDISYQDFVDHYARPGRPVVIRGAFKHLEAASLTPESLVERWGDKEFKIADSTMSLKQIVDRTLTSSQNDPAPYLSSVDVEADFPELTPLLSGGVKYAWPNYRHIKGLIPPWYFSEGHFTEFFLGGDGNGFPILHIDTPPMNTFIALFYGTKQWIIFDPSDEPNLYMDDLSFTSVADSNIFSPDFEKYPNLLRTQPTILNQEAGDLIFVPRMTVHTARNFSTSISVAWDQLSSTSWKEFIDRKYAYTVQKQPLKAKVMNTYLRTVGVGLGAWESITARIVNEKLRGRLI